MPDFLLFLKTYELWAYLILAIVGAVYLFRFLRSWNELRHAAFGLERESAQSRLNGAASMLFLLVAMTVTVFSLTTIVAPSVPGAMPLPSPTLDLLATPTITLAAPGDTGATTPVAPVGQGGGGLPAEPSACLPGTLNITQPATETTISGVVQVNGSASIDNFGFYKFETARPGETTWLSIQAGNQPVVDGELGNWDTSRLSTGVYLLRLVVTDNQGQSLTPCVVQVNVVPPENP